MYSQLSIKMVYLNGMKKLWWEHKKQALNCVWCHVKVLLVASLGWELPFGLSEFLLSNAFLGCLPCLLL